MRVPPLRTRLLIVSFLLLAVGLPVVGYALSHNFEKPIRQFVAGKPVTAWPPPRADGRPSADALAADAAQTVLGPLRLAAFGVLGLAGLVAINRGRWRYKRGRDVQTFQIVLGRDDLSRPFRVQEVMEGLAGALTVRWYERLWRGQPHVALEIHRGPTGAIEFTVAGAPGIEPVVRAALADLYPDVSLKPLRGRPSCTQTLSRLKKARTFVLSLQTTRDYEHAFSEALVTALDNTKGPTTVQLVITPSPRLLHRRSRALLKRRERGLIHRDHHDDADPGVDSVVEVKELKGGLETQHRSLVYFDLRVCANHREDVAHVAGKFAATRSENELQRRDMRVRRSLYARRLERALPNPIPSFRTGVLSTSELATLWQLPRARVKDVQLTRSTIRRALAPPRINRDPTNAILRDERGPVGIEPADRKYGHALIGGQGVGKSSAMAARIFNEAHHRDPKSAIVVLDPKGDLAELALGLIPANRTVHYLNLGAPEIGFNPLVSDAAPGARASLVVQALIEANPPGAIQAASDSFLRQAITAVCAVEDEPTFWHVYRMLDFAIDSPYRERVVSALERIPGTDFARTYWREVFPSLLANKGFAAQALNPPRNKIERLISTREVDVLLRHPTTVDLDQIVERGEILIVNGAKQDVGEDNTVFVMQLLVQLLHRSVQQQQGLPEDERQTVALFVDEAHGLLTRSVATMLAEGRSAGLEATFAWQYSAQVEDEVIRSGLRSLLQSISIFRMREMEDARSLAGLAMEVYSDRISIDLDEQERLRGAPDDVVRLPDYRAMNLWIARGEPQPVFNAQTEPSSERYDPSLAEYHSDAQRQRGGTYHAWLGDPMAETVSSNPTTQAPAPTKPPPSRHDPPPTEPNALAATRHHPAPAKAVDDVEDLD